MSRFIQIGRAFLSLGKAGANKYKETIIDNTKEHVTDVAKTVTNGVLIKLGTMVVLAAIAFGVVVGAIISIFD